MNIHNGNAKPAVFTMTNDAEVNEVLVFDRDQHGRLTASERVATGGRGTGEPHLPSQSSVALSGDGRWLLVVNAGSDQLSLLSVGAEGLALADVAASGGSRPTSVAISGDLVYVLNNGTPNIASFRITAGRLVERDGGRHALSSDKADPAQIAFSPDGRTLVVTERGTDSISSYAVGAEGEAHGPMTIAATGKTPYGFDFTTGGALVVTEAFGGAIGAAAAASYSLGESGALAPVSGSVGDTRSEVCWAVVSHDGRFAYVTNFGDGTVSSYRVGPDGELTLLDAVAGSTRLGEKGVRDEAIARDGRHLYAIDPDAGRLFAWTLGAEGELLPMGEVAELPATVAGIAVS
jgi:6-phosphogluconolactonase